MVYDAEATARNAELDNFNLPGYCLQASRTWAGINALYPTASIAWAHANDRKHGDRRPPRGSACYWTGGSKGYGHIAISLGDANIRSTDAGGRGIVATRTLAWFDVNWPSLHYAGWADNINEVTIPGVGEDEDMLNQEDKEWLRSMVKEEVARETEERWQFVQANGQSRAFNLNVAGNVRDIVKELADEVWDVNQANGKTRNQNLNTAGNVRKIIQEELEKDQT